MNNHRLFLLFAFFIFLFLLPSTALVFAEEKGGEIVEINVVVEGDIYREKANVSYPARVVAARYGGFENYARAFGGKAPKERIFDFLDEGLGDRFFHILSSYETPPVNAKLKVNDRKPYFEYIRGKNGFLFDEEEAVVALGKALDGDTPTLSLREVEPEVTVAKLKEETRLKGRFSTSIATSSSNRKHNVKLALSAINARILESYERFSFNETVGERTEERGYKNAKIISMGEYVDGLGGGVCQAATTLYVAALKAGMTVNRVAAHTYAPSYVPPSMDAMVSSSSDLVFTNDGGVTYVFAGGMGDEVFVEFYGVKGKSVAPVSEVVEEYPCEKIYDNCDPEKDECVLVKTGVTGKKSRLYLVIDGRKNLVRENVYKPYPETYAKKQE